MVFLGQRFNTFEEFERAKEEYEIKQHVPYTVFNCYLATSYNKNVAPEKRMPEDMKWKEATIACTHYGKPRTSKHVEGKKKRNNQSTLKRFCTAKFNLNYSVLGKYLYVSKITEEHCNHQQSAENAKHYSRNRRPPAETIKKVEEMLGHEVKTHIIREEVLSCGVIATGQDLQNMRNKFLTSLKGAGQTAIEALMEQLKKLGDDDPGSVWEITHDENTKLISSVFFQTSYMRVALDKYPEVMLMDTTYNLSDNEMPLTVFEVVDCFGRGRIAGYALILSERTDVLCAALSGLKKACKKLDQVHVVYVDKSQAEISCIPSVFPNAEVHLCDFHVKKIFERKDVRRLCTKWNELEPVLERLRFAYSKEEYNKHYEELKTIAGGPDSNFMKYFDKNWHNSSLVWSDYQRNRTFTLGERTTSRLESHNAKIKKLINKKLPPAEVIFRLRVLDRNMKLENEHRVFNETVKTKYHKYSDDPILQEILRVNTPFVGKLLQKEYDKSLQPPSNTKHVVTTETCDCAYFQKFKLVCAHIFRERRLKGVHVYDHSLVPERWLLIVPSDNVQKNFENFEIIAAPIKVPKVKKVMSHEDRYTLVDNITKRICSIIANHAGDEYHHYVNVLKNMEDLLRLGKRVAVVGINKDGSAEHTAMDQSVIIGSDEKLKEEENVADNLSIDDEPSQIKDYKGHPEETKEALSLSSVKGLQLAPKLAVSGRPKGSRTKKKRIRRTFNVTKDGESDEDIDDVSAVIDSCQTGDHQVLLTVDAAETGDHLELQNLPGDDAGQTGDHLELQTLPIDVDALLSNPNIPMITMEEFQNAFRSAGACNIFLDEKMHGTSEKELGSCIASNSNIFGNYFTRETSQTNSEMHTNIDMVIDDNSCDSDNNLVANMLKTRESNGTATGNPGKNVASGNVTESSDPKQHLSSHVLKINETQIGTTSKYLGDRVEQLTTKASSHVKDNNFGSDFICETSESDSEMHTKIDMVIDDNSCDSDNNLVIDNKNELDSKNAEALVNPKRCFACGSEAVIKTTRKMGPNYGRRFYTCPLQASAKCWRMAWIDRMKTSPMKQNSIQNYLIVPQEKDLKVDFAFTMLNDGMDNALIDSTSEHDIQTRPSSPVLLNKIKEEPSSPVFGKSSFLKKKHVIKEPPPAKRACLDNTMKTSPMKQNSIENYLIVPQEKDLKVDFALTMLNDGMDNVLIDSTSEHDIQTRPSSPVLLNKIKEEPSSPVFGKNIVLRKKPTLKKTSTEEPTSPILCHCGLTAQRYTPLFGNMQPVWRCRRIASDRCSFTKSIVGLGHHGQSDINAVTACQYGTLWNDLDSLRPFVKYQSYLLGIPPFVSLTADKSIPGKGSCMGKMWNNVTKKLKTINIIQAVKPWDSRSGFPIVASDLIYDVNHIPLQARDFRTLHKTKWLNDYIIDSFFKILPNFCVESDCSIFILHTTALELASAESGLFVRAGRDNLLFNDLWLLPASIHQSHWILILVIVKRKEIIILDSRNNSTSLSEKKKRLVKVVQLMIDESHKQCFGTAADFSEWSVIAPVDLYHQRNSHDCGVFVCMWGYSIMMGIETPNERICSKSAEIRAWMAQCLLSQSKPKPIQNPIQAPEDDDKIDNDIAAIYDVAASIQEKKERTMAQPWDKYNKSAIKFRTEAPKGTAIYLSEIMAELWKATKTDCGAPGGCKGFSPEMLLCEGCREYYHLKCIGDSRRRLGKADIYLCPLHSKPVHTRTRIVKKPPAKDYV